jgi:LPXTG-site transpeptidase (sortase) family protein
MDLATSTVAAVLPAHIVIPVIGVDAPVLNPDTRDVDELDNYLTEGAVRYPGSGTLTNGNMFIFGHNTSFKVVHNKAYQTFDNLRDLKAGDEIDVYSATTTAPDGSIIAPQKYVYSVQSVTLKYADDAVVTFSPDVHTLTLTTCDVFGEKEQRYIVDAIFVGVE